MTILVIFFFSFFSLGCQKAANAQFKEADSRLTEAYHVLLNAKVCSDREFVRPFTQFPDAINVLPTDMVNSWHDKFDQFSIDHKKQEVGPISSGLVE